MLSRTFTSRTRRSPSREPAEDVKGPLGLTTLYDPPEHAITDLVFVHGLGGGSRSTWAKDVDSFWPQDWLPEDDAFQQVRIHTFGYNSSWDKSSTLNIHDFAKSLLGSLYDCPQIPRGSTAPIVLVGHSMGGLVIKKAYILARQMQEFESVATRVRAMFFLATPHRGSDLAQTLSRILHVAGPRPFVDDLHRNSIATQSINDEFPQHCEDLQLHSFYETVPMSFVTGKGLIVDKDSATLGYRNERREYLNANHREVCKFQTRKDINYRTVRNALASTIDDLKAEVPATRYDLQTEQRHLLDNFLGASDAPEDDLMDIDQHRLPSSCEWIETRESFRRWRDSSDAPIYWISAKPATGKSFLSGYVVEYLRSCGQDCVFYFFAYNDKIKSTISTFLRSVAWQMARLNPQILQIVLNIYDKDDQLSKMDYRTIWRKLFVDGILKAQLDAVLYLVVDALDECRSETETVTLLLRTAETGWVRILVTSRNRFEAHSHVTQPETKVFSEEIRIEDTASDISLYLKANMHRLPSINDDDRQRMVGQILRKSAGCFLWVCLVLQELRQVHTSTEIKQVLENIPSDMNELYHRILDNMSSAPYGKLLAKAILTWTVCSARPLTTHELHHALQLDIKDSIDDVKRSISSYCHQLIHVDSQSRVQILHQTARDFLLRPGPSEFAIAKAEGNKRLAMACLDYLNGNEMKSRGLGRFSARVFSPPARERNPFVAYACTSLFTHVGHVSSTDDDLLFAMAKFLNSSNVLSWIEYLAEHSKLDCLIKTGEALRSYLQRRTRHVSPMIGKEAALLDAWATDLVRLVTRFGKNLSETPSSIYHLVPPFCPQETAVRKQFALTSRSILVLGLSTSSWDDCLSTMFYPHETTCSLSSSDTFFAVGLSSGKILIYRVFTCQDVSTLLHGGPVRLMEFGPAGKVLSSACAKSVCVWDVSTWQLRWRFDIDKQCLTLALVDGDRTMMGAMKNNHLLLWDLVDGQLVASFDWTEQLEGASAKAYRRPTFATVHADPTEQSLLAILYRGQDILLWDLEGETLYDTYGKRGSRQSDGRTTNATVWSVAFNSAPGTNLLAAAYSDGDLILFDTSEGTVKAGVMHMNAQTLVSSPNGRTLASGDSAGTIQVFEFDTLKLLYRIRSEEYGIKALTFSGDSRRLLDIRGSHCRVWDLMVLLRPDIDEDNSETSSTLFVAPQETGLSSSEDVVLITALVCSAAGDVFFCGKEDGSIWLYETRSARQLQRLFNHRVSITQILFDDHSGMMSAADSSSRITVRKLSRKSPVWECAEPLLDDRVNEAVDQIIANRGHTRLLVCSPNEDTLYALTADKYEALAKVEWQDRGSYRWSTHPSNQQELILIMGDVAHLYSWRTMKRLSHDEGILLKGSIIPELCIASVLSCFNNGAFLATEFSEHAGAHARSKLLLFHSSEFNATCRSTTSVPRYAYLCDQIESVIGTHGARLLFLNSAGWVCSTEQDTLTVQRHFFIPAEWLSVSAEMMMVRVVRSGDIIFVKGHEVAVIKRGLENSQPPPQPQSQSQSQLQPHNTGSHRRKASLIESMHPGPATTKGLGQRTESPSRMG